MAKYGAKYLQWAPFYTSDPDKDTAAFPKYGTPLNLGSLVKVTDNPEMNSATIYGDNVLEDKVDEFKECPIDVELTDVSPAVEKAVMGATQASGGTDNDIAFSGSDTQPYGGFAFYISKIKRVSKVIKAFTIQNEAEAAGDEYTTKATESLTGWLKLMAYEADAENGK